MTQRRTGSERHHGSPQDGTGRGGTFGVAQVAVGVSAEGSRGLRICAGRATRRGSRRTSVEGIIGKQIGFDKFGELEVMQSFKGEMGGISSKL